MVTDGMKVLSLRGINDGRMEAIHGSERYILPSMQSQCRHKGKPHSHTAK